jgi:predicted dehydrogenase
MPTRTRRAFLKHAASATLLTAASASRAAGSNDRIGVALIGPGGRGMGLLKTFASRKDVAITHVCDADENRTRSAAKAASSAGHAPKAERDMRRVFDNKSVDAVVIATPDHWHAPATILACEAGKHVYVEKPASHNIREGRLMIDAARRTNRVVQVGTQSRSADHVRQAMDLLKSGAIGEVLISKAWNSQLRTNIGHQPPSDPPPHLDYDLWVGPAPMVPYQRNLLPSLWRWFYNFGCGDIGNDGVHDIDIARWGLGVETHPNRISALGGKYFFDDDQQFPDTQYVCFEYDLNGKQKQLIYEQRIWSPYFQEGAENGNAFYGTKGIMLLCKKTGCQVIGPRNKPLKSIEGKLANDPHAANFLDCIRTGNRPNAHIEIGHLSSCLSHLGNIATRLGRTLRFDPATEKFVGDDESNDLVRRQYREEHWAMPKGA